MDRAYAVFSYICGEIEWSSVGENNLAVVGFNANGPLNEELEVSFHNYRLSGLRGVGSTISCENNPITNLVCRLPSTQARRDEVECISALDKDTELLHEETTHQALASMLKPCPCSLSQIQQDFASFIRQENTAQNCYISAFPVTYQIAESKDTLTLTQQCCYSSRG